MTFNWNYNKKKSCKHTFIGNSYIINDVGVFYCILNNFIEEKEEEKL